MSGLESRNNPSSWHQLLDLALPIVDEGLGVESKQWTLGGGTAIALRLSHRISDDVDIFVPGIPLKNFVPSNNDAARRLVKGGNNFQWPGHYVKFELPEGEIDFLSAALETNPGFDWEEFRGRKIALETCEEVIIKKLRYRGGQLTERDAFDIAAVARSDASLADAIANYAADALPRLKVSLEVLAKRPPDTVANKVRPMEGYEDLTKTAISDCLEIIARAQEIVDECTNFHILK